MRAFILLLAPIVGSAAFQMTVDAGYIRGFAWAVPWVWALCASLWAGWLLSHDKLKIKLQGFHARVGNGIHPIRIGLCVAIFLLVGFALRAILPKSESVVATGTGVPLSATIAKDTPAVPHPSMAEVAKPINPIIKHKAIPSPSGPNQGMDLGTDNTIVGKIPTSSQLGSGNTIVGATDSNGNTIINRGGTAIGNGATADQGSIAIGAHAHAGGDGTPAPSINSMIENAGKLEGVDVSGGEVTAPLGGSATVLHNLRGGEASNIKINNSKVSSATSGTPAIAQNPAPIRISNSRDFHVNDNVLCNSSAGLRTNDVTDLTLSGNTVNNPLDCNWGDFVLGPVARHREDIGVFIDKWKDQMERAWAETNIPIEKKEKYRKELSEIREQLVAASGDERTFRTVTTDLVNRRPSFEVKLPY